MSRTDAGDLAAIEQVVQLYFAAIDGRQFERLDQVFTADAVLRYSLDESIGPPAPYPLMVERIRDFVRVFVATQHLGSAAQVELDGDRARARTNLRALHVQQDDTGARSAWTVYGVYEDVLQRTSAGWRIAERTFRVLHQEGTLARPSPAGRGQERG